MKIEQSEQELLGLLKMTEEEQIKWLDGKEILAMKHAYGFTESLADLAERLWRKAREIESDENSYLLTALCDVADFVENRKKCSQCGHELYSGVSFFWATDADAIHRIVAALIALQRAQINLPNEK
jgi:uncharacterized UBP type Zn finger protein